MRRFGMALVLALALVYGIYVTAAYTAARDPWPVCVEDCYVPGDFDIKRDLDVFDDATVRGTLQLTGPSLLTAIPFCGQQPNTGTNYAGPAVDTFYGGRDAAPGGTYCDALENATEATADAPVEAFAWRVVGMSCWVTSDPAGDIVVTARSAAADLSPSVTCTIAGTGSAQSCSTWVTDGAAPTIAAGATQAIKLVNLADLSAQDYGCRLFVTRAS